MRIKYLVPFLVFVLVFGFALASCDISRSTKQEDKVQVESRLETLKNPVKENKEENLKQDEDLVIKEEIIFSFAVFGDNRPKDDYSPQPEEFLRILKLIKDYNPDFAFSTGDIIYGGITDKEVIERKFLDFLDVISILNCKLYIAPGNHDVNNKISREYFQDFINSDGKSYYYFEYEDVYFIVLDAYEEKKGQIVGSQLLWLEDLLKILKEKKVFIFLHPPVYSILNPECITDGSLHIAFSDKENQNYLRYLFNEFKVDGVFSGHEHLFDKQEISNTIYIITGGSGANLHVSKYRGGFYHFLIIEIENNSWICKIIDIDGELIEKVSLMFN